MPARFTAGELAGAAGSGDPLLAVVAAAAAGPDGWLTQYLAGVPGLLRRYAGPAATRAAGRSSPRRWTPAGSA